MITHLVGEILPKFNRLGATAAKSMGRAESETLNNTAETRNNQCPETELNCRHVDFQSAVPFFTVQQDSCGPRTLSDIPRARFCPELNLNSDGRPFTGFLEIAALTEHTADSLRGTRLVRKTSPYRVTKRSAGVRS